MTPRQRFLATMHCQPRDHCPWGEMGYWPETLERWHEEGWPRDVDIHDFFGFDWVRRDVPVNMGLLPAFTAETLEETDAYRLVRRADGVVAKEFAYSGDADHPVRSNPTTRSGACRPPIGAKRRWSDVSLLRRSSSAAWRVLSG